MKNKPTILVVTGGYFPGVNFGGIATSRYNFSEAFGDDYDIAIVTRNHDYKNTEPYEGLHPGWNPYGKARVLYLSDADFCYREFSRIIAQEKPMLVYASGTITTYFYFNKDLFRAAKQAGVPVLVTPDGDVCNSAYRLKSTKKRLSAAFCRLFHTFRNIWFQATSEEEVENLQRFLHIPNQRIFLVSNPPELFPPRNFYRKSTDSLRVVFFSRIHPKKNLLYAIEVISKISFPISFDIYGSMEDTEYWDMCQQAIKSAPAHININYLGRVDASQAKQIAKAYDCFLFPTISENYGYVIEEALLCGCPVVISRGTTPWDDVHGKAGFAGDLSDPAAFTAELEKIAKMDQAAYDAYTAGISTYIREKLSFEKLRQAYEDMFEVVTRK